MLAVLLIILSAITGIALNHTGGLALAERFPQNPLLLLPYRHLLPDLYRYDVEGNVLTADHGQLQLNDQPLGDCERLTGFTAVAGRQLVGCGSQWLLFDNWQLLEAFDVSLLGLTENASLAHSVTRIMVNDGGQWYYFDSDTLSLVATSDSGTVLAADSYRGENRVISWQRLMQDLHSGRWFGAAGIWVMDAAAVILLLLSLSGLWLWWSRPRNRL